MLEETNSICVDLYFDLKPSKVTHNILYKFIILNLKVIYLLYHNRRANEIIYNVNS